MSEQFRQVGEFIPQQRRQIRSPRNPLDKATIVSVYPKDIRDIKVTIYPGEFFIPKGNINTPSTTLIQPSSWWRDVDIDQPLIEVNVAATVVAESVITDYCNGYLACNMDDMMPGLFYVPGEIKQSEVTLRFKDAIHKAKIKQDKWFRELVRLADSLWSRTNHNPLAIWDEMRLAATELGLDRAWIKDVGAAELTKCFACGNLRNPAYPICPSCRVIDNKHPLAGELKFASN